MTVGTMYLPAAQPVTSASGLTITTDRQRAVLLRPGGLRDAELLAQLYRRLSARTINLRYGAPRPHMPEEVIRTEIARVLEGDRRLSTALIGTVGDGAIAVAELVQSPSDRASAEIALLVRDDYQREGLGRALMRQLYQAALARGVRRLHAYLLVENVAIMRLIRGLGAHYQAETYRGTTLVEIAVENDRSAEQND